jgi:hypothetical protein
MGRNARRPIESITNSRTARTLRRRWTQIMGGLGVDPLTHGRTSIERFSVDQHQSRPPSGQEPEGIENDEEDRLTVGPKSALIGTSATSQIRLPSQCVRDGVCRAMNASTIPPGGAGARQAQASIQGRIERRTARRIRPSGSPRSSPASSASLIRRPLRYWLRMPICGRVLR